MDFAKFKAKWLEISKFMSEKGIPLPLLRDHKSGRPSVSLTMMIVVFTMWLLGVIGSVSGALKGIDLDSTFNMFLAVSSLYFGRRLVKDGSKIEVEDKKDE